MTQSLKRSLRTGAGALLILIPASAAGQTTNAPATRSWTIEVFSGGVSSIGTMRGHTDVVLPAGEPFATRDGLPSRLVSSWQFGDGADLFNSVLTRFGDIQGITFPPLVPLDDALRATVIRQGRRWSAGVRLGRHVAPGVDLEISVEHRRTPVAFTGAFSSALLRTSDSFQVSFQTLLATAPITDLTVTSSRRITGVSNHQTRLGGAIRWTVLQRRTGSVFVSVGGGADVRGGGTPSARLTGRYAGRLRGSAPFEETDTVTIAVALPRVVPVGTIGVGATYDVGHDLGIRIDATWSMSGGTRSVSMHAAPTQAPSSVADVLPSLTSPAIQFSTTPTHRSSLSGPSISMTTFTSRGMHRQVSFTAGVFRRF